LDGHERPDSIVLTGFKSCLVMVSALEQLLARVSSQAERDLLDQHSLPNITDPKILVPSQPHLLALSPPPGWWFDHIFVLS